MLQECKRHLSKSKHGLCALNGFPYHPMANGMLSWSGPVPEIAPENHDSPELHASNQQRQSATQLLSRQEDTDFTEAAQEADDIGSIVDIEEVSWIEVRHDQVSAAHVGTCYRLHTSKFALYTCIQTLVFWLTCALAQMPANQVLLLLTVPGQPGITFGFPSN